MIKKPTKKKFTVKEQRFIEFYNGNATDAARKAGYKNPERSGKQNVRKGTILSEIRKREQKRSKKHILNREQRQKFWTNGTVFDVRNLVNEDGSGKNISELDDLTAKMIQGFKIVEKVLSNKKGEKILERWHEYKLVDRNKASELLGRSEADFLDKSKLSGEIMLKVVYDSKSRSE